MFSCSFLIVITCGKNTGHRQFFRVTFTGTTKLKRPDHKGVKGKIIPFYSHTQNNFTCKHTTTHSHSHTYTQASRKDLSRCMVIFTSRGDSEFHHTSQAGSLPKNIFGKWQQSHSAWPSLGLNWTATQWREREDD